MAEEQEGNEDIERVQSYIKDQVKSYFDELKQAESRPVKQTEQEDEGRRQLREVINPIVQPDIQDARFIAADAKDEVRFYRKNPDALEYEEQIERTFMQLKAAGRATDRATIYKYVMGDEYTTDKEKFTDKQLARRQEQMQRADVSQDMGMSALSRARNDPKFKDFDKLSIEDMEKALDGVTF